MTTYQLPEPYPNQHYYTAEQMQQAYKAGRESMREEAVKVCRACEYTGWNGEYMDYGPETNANEEIRRVESAIKGITL